MGIVSALKNRLMPPLPDSVRDAFTLLQFRRLQRQVPTLYAALILIVGAATLIAGKSLPFWLRIGIPTVVGVVALARLSVWLGRRNRSVSTDQARHLIRTMVIVSTSIAVACSFWCVYSWSIAEPVDKIYFPLFISMGALSTAYCISTVRMGAMLCLLIGMVPINTALLLYGNSMDQAAAGAMLVACAFLTRMIQQQHDVLRDLLLLQNDMHTLATTDPLTGLLNRRALQDMFEDELAQAEGADGPVVALLDLDGFKPVNDRHGHGAGDELLRDLARRLQATAGARAHVARLGGDEFAILIKAA
ncbi:MAG TPA: diguanylate cyclase, partial [Chakrabartia sp.]|nr:diguanylate cyclase [Chakrabartia sp.]